VAFLPDRHRRVARRAPAAGRRCGGGGAGGPVAVAAVWGGGDERWRTGGRGARARVLGMLGF